MFRYKHKVKKKQLIGKFLSFIYSRINSHFSKLLIPHVWILLYLKLVFMINRVVKACNPSISSSFNFVS